jgi:hypothetical protein
MQKITDPDPGGPKLTNPDQEHWSIFAFMKSDLFHCKSCDFWYLHCPDDTDPEDDR